MPKRRTDSRGIFGGRDSTSLGDQLSDQVRAGEFSAYEILQLLARGQQYAAIAGDQDKRRSELERQTLTQLSRDHQPTAITHHDLVSPTHRLTVPSRPNRWEA